MRIELVQIRKYSPSEDIVNEMIYFVYDKSKITDRSFSRTSAILSQV